MNIQEILLKYKHITAKINALKKKNNAKTNLIAVSKTFPAENIEPLIIQGHLIYGENKVQEALSKWLPLKKKYKNVQLHLIGPLQSNKINAALEIFDVIETIDREKLVNKISPKIQNIGKDAHEFFVQVNTGNESQKSGLGISEVKNFVGWAKNDKKLNITGLMCIPPVNDNPIEHFKLLRKKKEECKLKHLSMGMSKDFEIAIQNGSTFVRVGSAIFGQRS
mgnify:FL=1